MGLLGKLWNLTLTGCTMDEPLKTMLESKQCKTMDVVGYLRSVLEEYIRTKSYHRREVFCSSRPYARMKLMVVGVQGIGKTSLLEQLRSYGSTVTLKRPPSEVRRA